MADHAGPRRFKCHPETNFWHPPIEETQFWHQRSGLAPVFCKAKKDYIDQEGGGKVWNKSCWKWFKLLFCFIPMIFFWSFKYENGLQNRSSGAKTGLLRRAGTKLSSRVTLATSGAGVVSHMYIVFVYFSSSFITFYSFLLRDEKEKSCLQNRSSSAIEKKEKFPWPLK